MRTAYEIRIDCEFRHAEAELVALEARLAEFGERIAVLRARLERDGFARRDEWMRAPALADVARPAPRTVTRARPADRFRRPALHHRVVSGGV